MHRVCFYMSMNELEARRRKKGKKEMQSECFGRYRSDATRSEERVRYSTFALDNCYEANLTPMKN